MFKKITSVFLTSLLCVQLFGCQLQLVSDLKTSSVNGVTVQHEITFDEIAEISTDNINGFKFAQQNIISGDTHYDYGWVLSYKEEITDIDDLQEKVRQFTCANMTHRWYETRNSQVDGVTTLQGYYENIAPGANGFADKDIIKDKYNVDVYSVASNGNTLICILAINQTSTQFNRSETSTIQGSISLDSELEGLEESVYN